MHQKILNISVSQYVCFGVCLLLMAIIPIVRSNKIFGIELDKKDRGETVETIQRAEDGSLIVNTTELGKNVTGYTGNTPVEIYLSADGKITKIKTLPNQETPEFFGAVVNGNLLESLNGLTLEEALHKKIDAVTGATYSSNAVIQNINLGVNYALKESANVAKAPTKTDENVTWKFYVILLVILAGAMIPLFLKNKKYRIVQLILNVAILGFWGGSYLSYSLMVSGLTNGMLRVVMIPAILMLILAFIYPMFGKPNHYCNWICPYGALQELAGKCVKYKFKLPKKLVNGLTVFRNILWFCLMWLLWTGIWVDWMDYEPFAAFFFTDASIATLIVAGVFILLSFVIQRPYCRFVCPTGTLFKLSEGDK